MEKFYEEVWGIQKHFISSILRMLGIQIPNANGMSAKKVIISKKNSSPKYLTNSNLLRLPKK